MGHGCVQMNGSNYQPRVLQRDNESSCVLGHWVKVYEKRNGLYGASGLRSQ